jgi:hypothetical protein
LAVSFEIEFYSKDKTETLDSGLEKFKKEALGSASRNLVTKCNEKMFKVDKEDDEKSWMWEMEKGPFGEAKKGEETWCDDPAHFCEKGREYQTMFEASTPQAMEENETEIAIVQSQVLERYFSQHPRRELRKKGELSIFKDEFGTPDPPGLHVHVQSVCLLKDVRRLVALLLIWEKFDSLIYKSVGTKLHVGPGKIKSASIDKKTPALLTHLLSFMTKDGWTKDHDHKGDTLREMFAAHESSKKMDGDKTYQDGFRRFEVNVCHLLDIKCTHGLASKNNVPKFGGVEFRGFDPMVGRPLRLIVMVVERLVQFSCIADLHRRGQGSLHKLAFWDGKHDAKDLGELFSALDINIEHFHQWFFLKAKFAAE